MSALHVAAKFGHSVIVKALIEADAYVNGTVGCVESRSKLSNYTLNTIEKSLKKCDALQLDSEAEIEALESIGMTALHFAAKDGNSDIVRMLLGASASSTHAIFDGRTALQLAQGNGHVDVVRVLMSAAQQEWGDREEATAREEAKAREEADAREKQLMEKVREAEELREEATAGMELLQTQLQQMQLQQALLLYSITYSYSLSLS